jgi:hypothetical protein
MASKQDETVKPSERTNDEPKVVAQSKSASLGEQPGDDPGRPPMSDDDRDFIVASKSIDGDDGSHFEKHFVLLARDFGAGYDHSPNFTGTTQEAVNVGVRLTGDVEYIGKEDHPDGVSVILKYRAPVLPADHPDAPVNVVDTQEKWRDSVSTADERTEVDPAQVSPRTGDARYSEAGEDPKHLIERGSAAPGTPAADEKSSSK